MSIPQIDSYIFFDGNCAEAMKFYEKTLGGKMEMMMTGAQSPDADKLPPAMKDRILHAALSFNGRMLMASDDMSGTPYSGMKGFSLSLIYKDADETRRIFEALSAGGKVIMGPAKTFWAESFGMLTDKFGVGWMVWTPLPKA